MALLDVDSILDERIDPIDLARFTDSYEIQCRRGSPSTGVTFAYAAALVRSTKSDVKEGINLLEKLLQDDSVPEAKRDYVYFLAIANARMKDYDRALAYIDILSRAESHNRQAQELKTVIEKKMKRDGMLGAAILGGGAALVVGGILAAVMSSRK